MSFEIPPSAEKPIEEMTFEELENHPVYGPILQQKSLEYLQTEDKDHFNREYTGELDAEGYLIRKEDGQAIAKPSQSIGGGKAMDRVIEMVRAELGQ